MAKDLVSNGRGEPAPRSAARHPCPAFEERRGSGWDVTGQLHSTPLRQAQAEALSTIPSIQTRRGKLGEVACHVM